MFTIMIFSSTSRAQLHRTSLCAVVSMPDQRSTDTFGVDPASINAIQQRCLSVLEGSTACAELRDSASFMLRSGGLTRKQLKAAQLTGVKEMADLKPVQGAWTCSACTLENTNTNLSCGACGNSRKKHQPRWMCSVCTFMNNTKAAQCAACTNTQFREVVGGKKRVVPATGNLDCDDAEDFA